MVFGGKSRVQFPLKAKKKPYFWRYVGHQVRDLFVLEAPEPGAGFPSRSELCFRDWAYVLVPSASLILRSFATFS